MCNLKTMLYRNRFIFAFMAFTMAYVFAMSVQAVVSETRYWRDLTGKTPFRNVQVLQVEAHGLVLSVSGTLQKVRCESIGTFAYVRTYGDVLVPAVFSANRESPQTPTNRPASDLPQDFGPWDIISPIFMPKSGLIFKAHRCPEGLTTNLLLEANWPVGDKGK